MNRSVFLVGMRLLLLFLALTCAQTSFADAASLRRKIIEKLGANADIGAITKTPYGNKAVGGGIYEVYMNGRLHYVDENFTFMMVGTLIDTRTNDNYSETQMRKHLAVDLKLLPPLKNALKTHVGNGKKTLYVFSDPLCKHCQDLEKYLSDYPELTTYVYLVPNDWVNPGASKMARAIWCAKDPEQSYVRYMRQGKIPEGQIAPDCPTPFKENNSSAEQLGFTGTPGLIFGDGYRINGAPNANQLKSMIAKTPQ